MKAYQLISSLTLPSPWLFTVLLLCRCAVFGFDVLSVVAEETSMQSVTTTSWCGVIVVWAAEQPSVFGLIESGGMCFRLNCWLLFPFEAALQDEIQDVKTSQSETTPTQSDAPVDWMEVIIEADVVQIFTLSYFSEAETSAAPVSTLCVVVRDDDLSRPELFGSFLLFALVIYEHQLFLILGIPAMTTMWVGPICGTDSWHSTLHMSHRPEEGSDLEQMQGFLYCETMFWILAHGSC